MKCVIISDDGTRGPIELPDREPVILGRSPVTGITDSKVSRQHIQFKANYADRTVEVKQLGTNPCSVEGKSLVKNDIIVLSCDAESKVNFLEDKYPHSLQFKIEEIKQDEKKTISDFFQPKARKRKSESTQAENDTKRIIMSEESNNQIAEDDGSESDDENQKRVREHLRLMRENFKKTDANAPKASAKSQNDFKENKRKEKPPAMTGKPTGQSKWEEHGKLLMYTSLGVVASNKIAAFDIDSTIICTQSGKVFATHAGDWKIMLSETPGKLKKLTAEGYKIVFFTNQNGIQSGKVEVPEYKTKIENIISKLGVPVQVFVSTGHGPFRKPGLGMWNFLCQQRNDDIEVDVDESIYVGDAAGRPAGWAPGKKKDFSISDRLFALNAGLKFYTPEEYFLGHRKAPFNMPEFDPRNLPQKQLPEKITSKNQEVIVCVGFPASGKSFFAKKHLVPKGYVHVNRDTLKTWQKCIGATKDALRDGRSVVVDNTNPDPESRKRYIDCAKQAKVDCRCFVFTTSLTQCRHNERFREMTDKSHQPINDMIMNSFKSKFVDAKVSEGFNEIVKIDFIPYFTSEDQENLYKQFLLEK